MFCNHCGAQVPDDAKFCPKCGGALTPDSEAPQAEAPQPQPAPRPEPTRPAYAPAPEPGTKEEPQKPYMSLKDLFAGSKITASISKPKLIIAAVLALVLILVGLCSR